ncbi:glycosyltransferase family 2 protein [Hymenobacter sp. DH14]|uniref:Glycosyltransferase family 2 protein n=1 Tax=Hymenobacter cyanobacteriorum TaxID=2926463 RepID=A0A9X1VIP1_9BACT|nr:glycosyltransferase family 2 protein [Hymenobacter cyanobacteriorum]MCI1188913.1 glycosyltransferase family 2 protein [Hymenobacter cyanobacteriorum]
MKPRAYSLARPQFSVVSPVYQANATVEELVQRLHAALQLLSPAYEIILVDDRSTDDSWARIEALAGQDGRVRGLRLSRNFGQHRAITAGLDHCHGEWVVVLDCDLQDRPEEIPALFAATRQGFDLVLACRTQRRDVWHTRLLSRLFYWVLAYLTGLPQNPEIGNFGIYHRRVIAAVLALRESIRYFPTMVRWVGFRAGYLPVEHAARPAGRSTYSLSRRLGLGLDIVLVSSDKPLRLAVQAGGLLAAGALLFVPITLVRYWLGLILQPGYASLIISIWFFSGLLLAALGLVGLYVGKTFEQVKNRPLYLIDEVAEPGSPPAS